MNPPTARQWRPISLALLAGLLSQSSFTSPCCMDAESACDAAWSAQAALLEAEAPAANEGFSTQRIATPVGREVMVLAIEKGVDVTLVVEADGKSHRADSPLTGNGVQRVLFTPQSAGWTLDLVRKPDEPGLGAVALRVVAFEPDRAQHACAGVHRRLAAADAAYAAGSHQASLDGYRNALLRLGPRPASALQGMLMLSIASIHYWGPGDWASAQSWAQRAAQGFERLGDEQGVALAQAMRGAALIEVDPAVVPGSLELASRLLREAAQVHGRRGERREQADALNNYAISLYLAGEYAAASEAYAAAGELFQALDAHARQWQVVDNMALIDYELGNLDRARQTYARLLAWPELVERPRLHANVLTNSALVDLEAGEAGKALSSYQAALEVARSVPGDFYEALSLQGIGGAYEALGDSAMALTFYRRALALRTREAGARYRAETLWSIADVERRNGNANEALKLDLEALELAGTDLGVARMRLKVAADHAAMGQSSQAHAQLASILRQRVPGDDFIRARALLLRGKLRGGAGQWDAAKSDVAAALHAFEQFESAAEQFNARITMAGLLRAQGAAAVALQEVDAAIDLAERMRLQSANPGLRASVLETLRPAFDLKIGLLADLYQAATAPQARQQRALEALQVAERARSRALQDYERMEFTGPAAAKQARRRALYAQLQQYQSRFAASSATLAADDKVLASIRDNEADVRRQIDQIEEELAVGGAPATQTVALDLRRGQLPAQLGLVEYWLGADQAYAWVATRDALQMMRLGPTAVIEEAALRAQRSLQQAASTRAEQRLEQLRALGELIWEPLRDRLASQRTVVFVPDMALHYIPFAALPGGAGGKFLVEEHDVATAPSLRLLLAGRHTADTAGGRLLLVADPDYGQEKPRLAGSAREADAIAALVPPGRADRMQGRQATRESFLAAPLDRYRYIHVASHALADARLPQLSSLQLASVDTRGRPVEGQVLAADLMGIRLNADLVVLSACDTALGRVVSGEGVVGLRYVLLARGARAVASSLWRVGDRHTQELMSSFYASLLRQQQPAPAAMGSAMREAISRHGTDPATWAAFDLAVRDLDLVL